MLFLELYYFCSFYKQKLNRFKAIKFVDIQLVMVSCFGCWKQCFFAH